MKVTTAGRIRPSARPAPPGVSVLDSLLLNLCLFSAPYHLDEPPEAVFKREPVAVGVAAQNDLIVARAVLLDERPYALVGEEEDAGQSHREQDEAEINDARAGVFLHREYVRRADLLEVNQLELVAHDRAADHGASRGNGCREGVAARRLARRSRDHQGRSRVVVVGRFG